MEAAVPEMRTVNRAVITGVLAYVFVASCWLVMRAPRPRPTEPSVAQGPSPFDHLKAAQALKDLLKLAVVAVFILRQALCPFLGKPTDLQDAIEVLDRL